MDAKTIAQHQVIIEPDNIPSQLKKLNCFIRWRYFNDGNDSNKQYKSPVNSQLKRCAFNDKGSLLSFNEIVNEVDRGNVQLGLSLGSEGLMLQGNDELYLWCIDFDGFAEIGTTNVDSGVTKYFKKWPSYTEISPSGTGFKQFILSNKKPQVKHKVEFSPSEFTVNHPHINKYQHRAVEIFSKGLFLAMTGDQYGDEMLELAILSEADIDQLLDNLNNWAVDSGGKGTTLKASMRNVVTLSSSNTYSRLVKASLENVLTYIDNQDETTWCDVANALARVYGFEGQEYFVAYSRGDYNGQSYGGFNEGVVDGRFTRALAEVGTRPDGYGVKHLIDLANNHPDWNKPTLEFESPFADQTTNQDDQPKPSLSIVDQLRQYSLTGQSERLKARIGNEKFAMDSIAIKGQWTSIYAAPNTGKTLLTLWMLREQIQAGDIEPNNVFYINADDHYRGMTEKIAIAESFGMHVLVPNYQKFDIDDTLALLTKMAETDKADGVIVILDTAKKFTNPMDKVCSSDFGKVARSFITTGGTLIVLAHTNKHKDDAGKSIYSGTSDLVDDCDCMYIVDEIAKKDIFTGKEVTVEFANKKSRGDVADTMGFTYEKLTGQSYEELLDSIKRVSSDEVDAVKSREKIQQALNDDKEIITAACRLINSGVNIKNKLVEALQEEISASKARIKAILETRAGYSYEDGHRWSISTGNYNAKVFTVVDPPL